MCVSRNFSKFLLTCSQKIKDMYHPKDNRSIIYYIWHVSFLQFLFKLRSKHTYMLLSRNHINIIDLGTANKKEHITNTRIVLYLIVLNKIPLIFLLNSSYPFRNRNDAFKALLV